MLLVSLDLDESRALLLADSRADWFVPRSAASTSHAWASATATARAPPDPGNGAPSPHPSKGPSEGHGEAAEEAAEVCDVARPLSASNTSRTACVRQYSDAVEPPWPSKTHHRDAFPYSADDPRRSKAGDNPAPWDDGEG